MRSTLVLAFVVSMAALADGADAPIPQDLARMKKRRGDRLEWNRRTLQGA